MSRQSARSGFCRAKCAGACVRALACEVDSHMAPPGAQAPRLRTGGNSAGIARCAHLPTRVSVSRPSLGDGEFGDMYARLRAWVHTRELSDAVKGRFADQYRVHAQYARMQRARPMTMRTHE